MLETKGAKDDLDALLSNDELTTDAGTADEGGQTLRDLSEELRLVKSQMGGKPV